MDPRPPVSAAAAAEPLAPHTILSAEAEKFRQYLEQLLNLTKWALGLVGLIALGGIGFFGFRTFWEIDDRVAAKTDEAIKNYVKEAVVEARLDREVRGYADAAVVAYLATEAANQSRYLSLRIDGGTIENLIRILGRPDEPVFATAVQAISVRNDDLRRNADRLGQAILAALEHRAGNRAGNTELQPLDPEVVAASIRALGELEYQAAARYVQRTLTEGTVAPVVRRAAAVAARQLVDNDEREAFSKQLYQSALALAAADPSTAGEMIVTSVGFARDRLTPELVKLAKSGDPQQLSMILDLVSTGAYVGSFEPSLGRRFSRGPEGPHMLGSKLEVLAQLTLNSRVSLEVDEDESDNELTVWIASGDGSRRGQSYVVDGPFVSALARGCALGIAKIERQQTADYLQRVVVPLVDAGRSVWNESIRRGHITRSADPFSWRNGFVVQFPAGEKGRLHMVESFDSKTLEVKLYGPARDPAAQTISVPLSTLRLDGMIWSSP
jgi:hypothetical protein